MKGSNPQKRENSCAVFPGGFLPVSSPTLAERAIEYREEYRNWQGISDIIPVGRFTRSLLRMVEPFIPLEAVGGGLSR